MNSRNIRAARKAKLARKFAAMAAEPVFEVDGMPCPRSEFVAANSDDEDVVAWANAAEVGDAYPAVVPCVRVS